MHAQNVLSHASAARFVPLPLAAPARDALPRVARALSANTNEHDRDVGEPAPESAVFLVRDRARVRSGARFERVCDADVARAALLGDADAARAIWKRYGALVRSKLRTFIGTDEIEDHVQEVFLRFFERLPQLREHCALRNFLLGISVRVAATELRRRRTRRLHLTADGELPEANATVTPDHDAKEALARFDGVLASLGPEQRRVFELRYVDELDLAEISESLGLSLATVKRHLARVTARVLVRVERDEALADYRRTSTLDRRRGPRVADEPDAEDPRGEAAAAE
jgi:RNA polymerase sigma-70 factor (ECF subfamily)